MSLDIPRFLKSFKLLTKPNESARRENPPCQQEPFIHLLDFVAHSRERPCVACCKDIVSNLLGLDYSRAHSSVGAQSLSSTYTANGKRQIQIKISKIKKKRADKDILKQFLWIKHCVKRETYFSPAHHLHGSFKMQQCSLVLLTILQSDCAVEMAFK